MKTKLSLTHLPRLALLAGLSLSTLTLSGCSAPLLLAGGAVGGTVVVATDRRTSGIQLEDESIELKAGQNLRYYLTDRAHINANSYNRTVLLTGEVANDADKAKAEQVVSKIENVAGVSNQLEVTFTSSLSSRANDSLIAGKVKTALINAPDLFSNAYDVVVERGDVFLMGRVTEREANRAAEVASGVSGVKKVVKVFEIISEQDLARLSQKPVSAASAPIQ